MSSVRRGMPQNGSLGTRMMHSVDENASKTEPAKLLAVFVVDTDEKELLTPYKK